MSLPGFTFDANIIIFVFLNFSCLVRFKIKIASETKLAANVKIPKKLTRFPRA